MSKTSSNRVSQPAFPLNGDKWQNEIGRGVGLDEFKGLTKREYFAGLAMQGILSNPNNVPSSNVNFKLIAEDACLLADELLRQLGD